MTSIKSKQTKEKKTAEPVKIPSVLPFSLAQAVDALQNNAIRTSTEVKGGAVLVDTSYPPELLAAMRGMFPSGRVYDFQIHASATLATIAGGVFNTRVVFNPTVTTFAEWSALAALFDEVKLTSCQLDCTSAYGPTSTAIVFQICCAPDPNNLSGATPSFTVTQRLAESEFLHPYNMAAKPGVFTKVWKVPKSRPYALTSAPGGASQIPSGCDGQWNFASNIVGTATINILFAALKNVVHLRNRA